MARYDPHRVITAEVTGGTNAHLNGLKNGKLEPALSTNSEADPVHVGEGPVKSGKITSFKALVDGNSGKPVWNFSR